MVVHGAADPIVSLLVAEDKVPWYRKPNLRVMYLWLFFCCMGVEVTSGFDCQLINVLQFSPAFLRYFSEGYTDPSTNLPAIPPAILGFMSACFQFGSLFGVPVAPWLNQRYGRRWAIKIGCTIMIFGALLQGFSVHVAMYIMSRMILGFGLVLNIIAGSAMIGEVGHPKDRPTLTSLFNASFFIGAIVAAAIGLGTAPIASDWSWRLPSLLQVCPSLVQLVAIFFIPESPRWLISRDCDDEATTVLVKYHAEGDANSLLVRAELAQIKSTIKLELETSTSSWTDMIRTAGMRRRVFIAIFLGLFTQTSGNTLLSYYSNMLFQLMDYTTSYAKTRINLASNCWSWVNAMVLAFIVARLPRRVVCLTAAAGMLAVFIGLTLSFQKLMEAKDDKTTNHAAQLAAMILYFAYWPCFIAGNSVITYTYLVEIFPYAQRSRGIGIEQVAGKLGGFFSIYVNPLAMTAINWKFLAIYSAWLAFEFAFIYFFYPETHGRTLEELAFLFEDQKFADRATMEMEKELGSDIVAQTMAANHSRRGEK